MADREALRRSVVNSLTNILSGDQAARRSAENELKTLEVTEGEAGPVPLHFPRTQRRVLSRAHFNCRVWLGISRDHRVY